MDCERHDLAVASREAVQLLIKYIKYEQSIAEQLMVSGHENIARDLIVAFVHTDYDDVQAAADVVALLR